MLRFEIFVLGKPMLEAGLTSTKYILKKLGEKRIFEIKRILMRTINRAVFSSYFMDKNEKVIVSNDIALFEDDIRGFRDLKLKC